MKKSSQFALGASVALFLVAGTVKFWPEDRFLPSRPSFAMNASFSPSGGTVILPAARSFAPGWAEGSVPPRIADSGTMPHSLPIVSALQLGNRNPGERDARQGIISDASPLSKRPPVSLAARNMPVGEILAHLFHQAGVSFQQTDNWGETMTITFTDAPLEQAVSQTLSLTTRPRLTYRIENGVYLVSPAAPLPPDNTPPMR